jgi:hypothetical protein
MNVDVVVTTIRDIPGYLLKTKSDVVIVINFIATGKILILG